MKLSKKLIIVFRILVSIFVGTSLVSHNIAEARTLDHIRFQAKMHDITGQLYNVYLFSDDEVSEVKQGDTIYSGHYQFAIGNVNEQYVHIQPDNVVVWNSDKLRFNSKQVMNYVVERASGQEADVLFVSQFGDSDHSIIRGYYIRDGAMHRLSWINGDDAKVINSALNISREKVRHTVLSLYHTIWWDRPIPGEWQGGYHNIDWMLDTSKDSLICMYDNVIPSMYIIGDGSVGKIKKESSIAEIEKLITETYGGRIEQTYEMIGEGQKGNVINAYVNNSNQRLLKVILDNNGQVFQRIVLSPVFQTPKGIHVGSTWGEVRALYPQAHFIFGEANVMLAIPELRLNCVVESSNKVNWLKIVKGEEVAPNQVRIVSILVY